MKKISGKELRENTEKTINDLMSTLEIVKPSKQTRKVVEKISRRLSKELKAEIKKQLKKNQKATKAKATNDTKSSHVLEASAA